MLLWECPTGTLVFSGHLHNLALQKREGERDGLLGIPAQQPT